MTQIILASASPRRRELLSLLDLRFDVVPSDILEDSADGSRPELAVRRLAREKAEASRLHTGDATIVAADTIVVYAGEILGKPHGDDEARDMLRRLRGRWHEVVTGLVVLPAGRTGSIVRHCLTSVLMRHLGDEEIEAWIARGEPFDKAGGYAIQDVLLAPVESYEGCYCNVMGLPLWQTIEALRKAGIAVWADANDLLAQCCVCPQRLP